MRFKIIKSQLQDAFQYLSSYYEIFKNPTSKEISDLKKEKSSLRGIINQNGDIYVWDGDLLHALVLRKISIPDGIHFDFDGSALTLYFIDGTTPDILMASFNNAINKLSILGITPNTKVVYINTSYYGAKEYAEYESILGVADILVLKNQELSLAGGRKMSRLKRIADYKTVGDKIREFGPLCDEILKISLESCALNIDFPYDDGVFELVSQDPEYRQIVDNDLKQTIQKIKGVAEKWADNTKINYPEELNKE